MTSIYNELQNAIDDIVHSSIRRRPSPPSHLRLIPQMNEIAGTEQALKKHGLAFEC